MKLMRVTRSSAVDEGVFSESDEEMDDSKRKKSSSSSSAAVGDGDGGGAAAGDAVFSRIMQDYDKGRIEQFFQTAVETTSLGQRFKNECVEMKDELGLTDIDLFRLIDSTVQ